MALLLALPSIAAAARPRDEVMSRAYLCAGMSDARVWLDCYYGAAQPARAALGLPPAPAAQAQLPLSRVAGSSPPQEVAVRDSVLSHASNCADLSDDRQWLNCYYAAAEPMRSGLGLRPVFQAANPKSGSSSPAQVVALGHPSGLINTPEAADQGFGLSDDPIRINSISSLMTSYAFDKEGFFTVGLSNGQVWRQVTGDTTYAHWKGTPRRYLVRVSRGFLGSFNLQVRNGPGLYKVRRLQ